MNGNLCSFVVFSFDQLGANLEKGSKNAGLFHLLAYGVLQNKKHTVPLFSIKAYPGVQPMHTHIQIYVIIKVEIQVH